MSAAADTCTACLAQGSVCQQHNRCCCFEIFAALQSAQQPRSQLAEAHLMQCCHCSNRQSPWLPCRGAVSGWRHTGMLCQAWGRVRFLPPVGKGRRHPPWPGPRHCWPSQPIPAPCPAGTRSVQPSPHLLRSPSPQVRCAAQHTTPPQPHSSLASYPHCSCTHIVRSVVRRRWDINRFLVFMHLDSILSDFGQL